jgi:hypothetical protein
MLESRADEGMTRSLGLPTWVSQALCVTESEAPTDQPMAQGIKRSLLADWLPTWLICGELRDGACLPDQQLRCLRIPRDVYRGDAKGMSPIKATLAGKTDEIERDSSARGIILENLLNSSEFGGMLAWPPATDERPVYFRLGRNLGID